MCGGRLLALSLLPYPAPLSPFFPESQRVHARRLVKARAKGVTEALARRLAAHAPGYTLDHLVREASRLLRFGCPISISLIPHLSPISHNSHIPPVQLMCATGPVLFSTTVRQVRRWPAWKCPRHPCIGSHPGTPTPPPPGDVGYDGYDLGLFEGVFDGSTMPGGDEEEPEDGGSIITTSTARGTWRDAAARPPPTPLQPQLGSAREVVM